MKMILKNLVTLTCVVFSLVFVGCAGPASGLRSEEKNVSQYLAERPEVPAGKARVLVYVDGGAGSRWSHKTGFLNLDINSNRIFSKLGNTRYDSAIVDAGPARVMPAGEGGELAECIQNYFFPPGETTFIKVSRRESAIAAQAFFGLIGAMVEAASAKNKTECGGSWKTELIARDSAIKEINDIGK